MRVFRFWPVLSALTLSLIVPGGTPAREGGKSPYLGFEDDLPPWTAEVKAAEKLWAEGRREQALERWERARELGYQDSLVLARLGLAYYERGDYAGAVSCLAPARIGVEQGAGEEGLKLELYRALCDSLFRLGRRTEALIGYRRALAVYPADLELRLGLAETHLAGGGFPAARAEAEKALALAPGHPRALAVLGRAAEAAGDFARAAAAYRGVLAAEPARSRERFALGCLLFYRFSDLPAAAAELALVLAYEPAHAPARALLAEILLREGKPEEAEIEARRALADDPESYNALVILGRISLGRDDRAAEEFFRRAYALDPAPAGAEYGLGVLALQAAKPVEAEVRLRRALRREPGMFEAAYHLGVALDRQGKRAEARKVFLGLVESRPDYFPAHLALGKSFLQVSDPASALPYFLNAAALNKDDWEARFYAGKAFLALEKYRQALEEFAVSAALAPLNPAVGNETGLAYWKLGETAKAEEAFRKALALDPDYIRARINLSVLAAGLRRFPSAAEEYRQALIIRPGEIRWGYPEEPGELLREISEGLSRHLATGVDYISLYELAGNLAHGEGVRELVPLLEKLSASQPRQPGYPFLLGLCAQDAGDLSRAESYFNRALQLDLDFAPAHLSLGRLLLLRDRPREARSHLEAFLSLAPPGPGADAAAELLGSLPPE